MDFKGYNCSMFIDEATIVLKSGRGGDGAVSFRREKYIAQGGPDGGSGGRGGDLYIESTNSLNTLVHFNNRRVYSATNGENGRGKNMSGRAGEDIVVQVPVGTVVRDASGKLLLDFREARRVLFLEGGRGGVGNTHFKSSKRQTPYIALKGKEGLELEIKLELKLLADVALVGMPNAGKSTLINTISAAKSKVGAYPFTTLVPKLGVVKFKGSDFVVADVPGLIEGASDGKGLGDKFLKHIERARLILHLIDLTNEDFIKNYEIINSELAKYRDLKSKEQLIVATKVDEDNFKDEAVEYFSSLGREIFFISSFSREGIEELLNATLEKLSSIKDEESIEEIISVSELFKKREEEDILVIKESDYYLVKGRIVNSIMDKYVLTRDTFDILLDILRREGLDKRLKEAGAQSGSRVKVLDQEFEFIE